jgi:hypothetical protein
MHDQPFAFNYDRARRVGQMYRPSPGHRYPKPNAHLSLPHLPESDFTFVLQPHGGTVERVLDGTFDQHIPTLVHENTVKRQDVLLRLDCAKDRLFAAWFGAKPEKVRAGFREAALPLAPSIETHTGRRGTPPDFSDVLILVWLYDGALTNAQLAGIEERLTERWSVSRFVGKGLVDIPLSGSLAWETEPSTVSEAERLKALADTERLGTDDGFMLSLRDRAHPDYAANTQLWSHVWTLAYPLPARERCGMVTGQGNLRCGEEAQRHSIEDLDQAFLAPLRQAIINDTYAP